MMLMLPPWNTSWAAPMDIGFEHLRATALFMSLAWVMWRIWKFWRQHCAEFSMVLSLPLAWWRCPRDESAEATLKRVDAFMRVALACKTINYGFPSSAFGKHTPEGLRKALVDDNGVAHIDCRLFIYVILSCFLPKTAFFDNGTLEDFQKQSENLLENLKKPQDQRKPHREYRPKLSDRIFFHCAVQHLILGSKIYYVGSRNADLFDFWMVSGCDWKGHWIVLLPGPQQHVIGMADDGITLSTMTDIKKLIINKRKIWMGNVTNPESVPQEAWQETPEDLDTISYHPLDWWC